MTATDTTVTPDAPDTPARHLLGWDCIEFWVGNARTTAGFLMSHFGFRCTAYAGPETGPAGQGQLRARAGRHPLRRVRRAARRLADRRPRAPPRRRRARPGLARRRRRRDLRRRRRPRRPQRARAVGRDRRARRPRARPGRRLRRDGAHVRRPQALPRHDARARLHRQTLPNPTVGPPVGLVAIDHVVGNVEQGELDTGSTSTPT